MRYFAVMLYAMLILADWGAIEANAQAAKAEAHVAAAKVAAYASETEKKTEVERTATDREKTGLRSGFEAVHPVTGDDYLDHADYPLWLGKPLPLLLESLRG